jgi:hypothetical protein
LSTRSCVSFFKVTRRSSMSLIVCTTRWSSTGREEETARVGRKKGVGRQWYGGQTNWRIWILGLARDRVSCRVHGAPSTYFSRNVSGFTAVDAIAWPRELRRAASEACAGVN